MPVTASNLMQGPIRVFHALFGAVEPATADVAFGAPWTDLGGTIGGATLNFGQSYSKQVVDQVGMAVGAKLTGQEVGVVTRLAEITLENLRRAVNQASAAASKVMEFGGEDIVNQSPLYSAIALQGLSPAGTPRLWIVRKTLSMNAVGVPFEKEGDTVIPIAWEGFYVSQSIRAVKIDESTAP